MQMRPRRKGAKLPERAVQILIGIRLFTGKKLEHHHAARCQPGAATLLDHSPIAPGNRPRRLDAPLTVKRRHPGNLALDRPAAVIPLAMKPQHAAMTGWRFDDIGGVFRQVDQPRRRVHRHIPQR